MTDDHQLTQQVPPSAQEATSWAESFTDLAWETYSWSPYCALGSVLGPRDAAVNKKDEISPEQPHGGEDRP